MDFLNGVSGYFELQRKYDELYRGYIARGVNRALSPSDTEFVPEMTLDAYLGVGVDALRIIVSTLVGNLREPPKSILDFPSGSGRVTRHIQAFFPEASIVAADLYKHHVEFCVNELGTQGMISQENLDAVDFGPGFDLIFCGSLLTHLPEEAFRATLRLVSRSLSDTGIAILSVLGRHAEYIQRNKWNYVDDKLYTIVEAGILNSGYGYVDYDDNARSVLKLARYGLSWIRPHWTLKVLEDDYEMRILGYVERAWHDHQDIFVLGKPGINALGHWPDRVPAVQ